MKKVLISALILILAVGASVYFQPGRSSAEPADNTVTPDAQSGSGAYTSQISDDKEDTAPVAGLPDNTDYPDKPDDPDNTNTVDPSPSGGQRTVEGVILGDGIDMGAAPEGYFADSLFVGDSRMYGLQLYGDIKEGYWYAATSMAVFNYNNKPVDVAGFGSTTLDNLLQQKKFSQIYVNMGINEIGYEMTYLKNTYTEFYNKLRSLQPDAKIIIISNLHVTKAYSDTSTNGITNPRLNELNEHLKSMQDGQHIFYLDINHLFDDANGALAAECTGDGVHVYGQQYLTTSEYLRSHAIY